MTLSAPAIDFYRTKVTVTYGKISDISNSAAAGL